MEKSWFEVACTLPSDLADEVATYLGEVTQQGVCSDNRVVDAFSPEEIAQVPEVTVKVYLPADGEVSRVVDQITAYLEELATRHPAALIPPPQVTQVCDEDWATSWKVHFKPLRVGRRLLVVPTWEQPHPRPDGLVLRIDPGMAFGTGGHETTRLCLELLETIMDTWPLMDSPTVLDLGTGSGILAMAAAQLGAAAVHAVDLDPLAVETARDNIAVNGLEGAVTLGTEPLESLPESYDIILANILAEELARLAPALVAHMNNGGELVLSGILSEKEPLVKAAFSRHDQLHYRETLAAGEWVALRYHRGE